MIRFVHTADIHFGVENYGKIDPQTGIHTRLQDFYDALNIAIDYAIETQVDFFLFAGDAYKTSTPSPTQQRMLFKSFLRLHHADIPLVIVVGNHDHPLSFGKANALSIFGDVPLDGFHVIQQPTSLVLETKNGPVQVVGIPWPTRNTIATRTAHMYKNAQEITQYISQAVVQIIEDFARQLDHKTPAVLAGHLTVSSGIFSGSEKRAIWGNDPLFLPSQLAIPPFDYVALGHLHRHQNLNINRTPLVYAGSIERVDFGERNEEKGFCAVTIENKKATYQFIPIATRPFIQFDIHLKAGPDYTRQILDAIAQKSITNAVIKIVYHLPEGKKDSVEIGTIQRACENAMYIAGITPVHNITTRTRRTNVNMAMDLPTLLNTYFDTKPELKENKAQLIAKALELEATMQQENIEES